MDKDTTVQTMTRFEYIAIKAMQAMISNGQWESEPNEDIAEIAIGIAKEMESKLSDHIFWGE